MTVSDDRMATLDPDQLAARSGSFRPWSSERLAFVLAANVVALGLIAAGWYQVSGQRTVGDALVWLNLGLAGVGVAGTANGLWLFRGCQVVRLARGAVLVRDVWWSHATTTPEAVSDEVRPVTGKRMSRYHRPTCSLVAGKPTTSADARHHQAAGLVACQVCEP